MMKISAYGLTDIGRRRGSNQDRFVLKTDSQLFGVADGMGGHKGGGTASSIAVETIKEFFQSHESDDTEKVLVSAMKEASRVVFEESIKDPSLAGMGTTSTFAVIKGNRIYIGHVGDSRAYLIRGGRIWQLTEDHSLVHEQVKAGLIPERAEKNHMLKNVLTRSIGFEADVEVDLYQKNIESGDIYLICSDGLFGMIDDAEIARVISESAPSDANKKLINLANDHGGEDNITSVVINVEETD